MPTATTPPARCKQLSRTQLLASFDCDFAVGAKGQVTVAPEWKNAWLVPVSLPIPTGITTRFLLHKRAAPVFEAWFRLWTPGVCKTVRTFDGSFVPRLMRLAKNLPEPVGNNSYTRTWGSFVSRHTRGIAVDLNSRWNGQGVVGAAPGKEGDLHPVIDLARQVKAEVKDSFGKTWTAGIVCGSDWRPLSVTDFTHFEIGFWPEP